MRAALGARNRSSPGLSALPAGGVSTRALGSGDAGKQHRAAYGGAPFACRSHLRPPRPLSTGDPGSAKVSAPDGIPTVAFSKSNSPFYERSLHQRKYSLNTPQLVSPKLSTDYSDAVWVSDANE